MKYDIINEDVIRWCDGYSGPPFCSILTDPPYHLHSGGKGGFMGKKWDGAHEIAFNPETWRALGRHLLPGAYLLAFGGTRTYHRLTCAIEDAGFEIKTSIAWVFAQGFPKSLSVSKQIDRMAGAERKVVGPPPYKRGRSTQQYHETRRVSYDYPSQPLTADATDLAKVWHGYGSALKPCFEPIVVAQKPVEGTITENCVKHGAGALNVDKGRVQYTTVNGGNLADNPHLRESINGGCGGHIFPAETERRVVIPNQLGRWPSNLILDGSAEVSALFPDAASCDSPSKARSPGGDILKGARAQGAIYPGERGSASRFFNQCPLGEHDVEPIFYCAKAASGERNTGLSEKNSHPTVKPVRLCQHLATLTLPPKEYAPRRILIPFAGSSSEMLGAMLAGWDEVLGIEADASYVEIAKARLAHWHAKQFGVASAVQYGSEEDF